MSDDEKYLLVSAGDGVVRLYDKDEGESVSEYSGVHRCRDFSHSVKFAKDGSFLFVASEDNRVVLYDLIEVSPFSALIEILLRCDFCFLLL